MSATTEYLQQLGISLEEAKAFLANNSNSPGLIYKASHEHRVTTDMLAEIMGDGATAADFQSFMQRNGYDTDILDLSTADYVAKKGANVNEIREHVMANMHSPDAVFELSAKYALTPDMLADIVGNGFSSRDVVKFFGSGGYDEGRLEHGNQESHDTFVPFEMFGGNPPPFGEAGFFPPFSPPEAAGFSSYDGLSANTAGFLQRLGVSLEEAKAFLANNSSSPDAIYKASHEHRVTTDMLAEIMADGATAADFQSFMQGNGYDTDILDLSTADYVAKKGANVNEIREHVMANMHSPDAVFELSAKYALTPDMLADIVGNGFSSRDVVKFFGSGGYDEGRLEHGNQGSHDTFVPFEMFGGNPPPFGEHNKNPPPSGDYDKNSPPSGDYGNNPPPSGDYDKNPPPPGDYGSNPPPADADNKQPPADGGDSAPPPANGGNSAPPPAQVSAEQVIEIIGVPAATAFSVDAEF